MSHVISARSATSSVHAQSRREELTHWKRLWCWEGLGAGGKGDDRGWDGWIASPTWWTWVWVNSGSWWLTGRPGVLQFMGSQRVGHDWATELNWWCLGRMVGVRDSHWREWERRLTKSWPRKLRWRDRQYIYTMMFCISCQESRYRNLEGKCFEKDLQLAGLEERASILTRNSLKWCAIKSRLD